MAEYMTVENNIITGIFCGEVEESENIIILPDNHQVRGGETLEYYNQDWTRKSEAELIRLGLEECPQGYILDGDTVREMNFDERIIAGIDPLSRHQKIVDGKLVDKTEDELWSEKSTDEKNSIIRQKRDGLINKADILLLKYQEQVQLGIIAENNNYYTALLQYKQALRDIPEQPDFPEKAEYPTVPKYEDYE